MSKDAKIESANHKTTSKALKIPHKDLTVMKKFAFPALCDGKRKKPVFWMSLSPVEINMESSRILVTGLPHGTTKTQLTIYFQSQRDSGGGDVKNIDIDVARKQAVIAFEDVEGNYSVLLHVTPGSFHS